MSVVRTYVVSAHGSIIHTGSDGVRRVLRPGTRVDDSVFTQSQIVEHVRSGYLVPTGMPVVEQKDFRPDPSGPILGGAERDLDKTADTPLVIAPAPAAAEVSPENVPAPGTPVVSAPKWNLNPMTLAGMTLPQLNARIAAIDPSAPKQGTVKAAIGYLSSEFKG